MQVFNVGDKINLNYKVENLGNSPKILLDILNGESEISKQLAKAKKPMLIIGNDILKRKDGQDIFKVAKQIAKKYNFIQENFNGFNVLQKFAGRVGALDLGLVPKKQSTNINTILQDCENGKIKAVILLSVDEIDFSKLKNTFVVYIGSNADKGALSANVILPATSFAEKSATFVNLEGRVQQTKKAVSPINKAKEDFFIINEIANSLGINLGFKTLEDVRHKMVKINPIFFELDVISKAAFEENNEKDLDLSTAKITSIATNFYQTNPILRCSKTMAKCTEELWKVA